MDKKVAEAITLLNEQISSLIGSKTADVKANPQKLVVFETLRKNGVQFRFEPDENDMEILYIRGANIQFFDKR